MNTTSLCKEIECLNQDIDKCKGRLENGSKKNSCPPNCYCDKRAIGLDLRSNNNVVSTRTKTATAKVTKMDIAPQRYQEKDPSKFSGNQKSKKYLCDDVYSINDSEENQSCLNSRKNNVQIPMRCQRDVNDYLFVDNINEPVKLPKKCSHLKKETSWSAILKQNSSENVKENIDYRCIPTKDCYTQVNSSSGSSTTSAVQPIYMKNKGVQCVQESLPKEESRLPNDPLNAIQYLITNMKSRLKDDPRLGNMLDEMELVLGRIPLDRGDNYTVGHVATDYRSSPLGSYLYPRPNFTKQQMNPPYNNGMLNLETTYRELEATCAKLKKERDAAVEKASRKSTELVESMRREVETKAKLSETNSRIKEMSTKLETYTRSMEGLTEHVKRLQSENKDMERIRGQVAQLSSMMRDVTQENKNLLAELQLVTIERNKLEVALALKEQDLQKKEKELENVEHLLVEKKSRNEEVQRIERPRSPEPEEILDVQSYKNELRGSLQLATSSPNSSSSDSILRARINSWVALSTISSVDRKSNNIEYPIYNRPHHKKLNTVNAAVETVKPMQTSAEVQTPSLPQEVREKRPDLNKIEKLKEEIRHMFSEMRELAQDVPPVPVVEFSSISDLSELNWSEVRNTINSCESVSDFHQSELNDIRRKYKQN